MEAILEAIYSDERYNSLVRSLDERDRRGAYLLLRLMVGGDLTERQLQRVLSHIQLQESSWKDAFGALWGGLTRLVPKVFRYLLGLRDPNKLRKAVERDLPKIKQAADEVAVIHNIKVTTADAQELIRRTEAKMARAPEVVVDHIRKALDEYVDDDKLSAERFTFKWVLLFIYYNIALFLMGLAMPWSFAPAFLSRFAITHLPVLYVAIVDLMDNLNTKKLAP